MTRKKRERERETARYMKLMIEQRPFLLKHFLFRKWDCLLLGGLLRAPEYPAVQQPAPRSVDEGTLPPTWAMPLGILLLSCILGVPADAYQHRSISGQACWEGKTSSSSLGIWWVSGPPRKLQFPYHHPLGMTSGVPPGSRDSIKTWLIRERRNRGK